KPREYRGLLVPDVLLEGDHKKIEVWRRKESLRKTWKNRKDLLSGQQLSEEEKSLLQALETKKKNQ
ncbi:MAG: tRNA (guanosine(37)-N1)-methyltransferase TrmD, partial [Deltaproteobacteria bacterium CG_4_10_14_0_2_um_filter_43_8]